MELSIVSGDMIIFGGIGLAALIVVCGILWFTGRTKECAICGGRVNTRYGRVRYNDKFMHWKCYKESGLEQGGFEYGR